HIHPKQNIDIDHIQLSNLITNYRILQLVWSEPRRRWCVVFPRRNVVGAFKQINIIVLAKPY
ncbi:hypothetical protein LINPERPRIM_LOCUS19736, partial [Linum perenne]